MVNSQRTVMVFGTFDIVHLGHIALFKEAKKHGDKLIVVVARDKRAAGIKGEAPIFGEKDRMALLKEISSIDQVLLGDKSDVYKMMRSVKPDVIVLGYDQKIFTENLEEKINEFGLTTKIIRAKAYKPKLFKSTIIKSQLPEEKQMKHLVVPIGIVVKKGKILLNKRNDRKNIQLHGLWEFPGGGMKIGETVEENLIREVEEESGYIVEIVSMLKKIWTINSKNSPMVTNQNLNIYLIPFVCKIIGGEGKIQDEEVLETTWVQPEKVEEYDLIPENRKFYKIVFPELIEVIKKNNL